MRTEPRSPLTSVVGGLRDRTSGVFRRIGGRGPMVRVLLVVAILGAVGAAGYLATLGDASVAYHWLYPNQKLSASDLDAIAEALGAEGIEHVQMDGRIGVRAANRALATAALDKRKFAPATLDDLRKQALNTSVFDGPDEKELKERTFLERELQLLIETYAGVRAAHVRLNRSKSRVGPRSAANVTAFVRVDRESERELPNKTQMAIKSLLDANIPDLHGALTLMDETGHVYLTAGNPSHEATIQTHAREDEYREELLEQLRHIRGLDVTVRIEKVTLPLPEVPPSPPTVHLRPIPATEPPPAVPAEEVKVNQPLEDPDLVARPDPPPPITVVPAPTPPPGPPPTIDKAKVWVRVPKSYYLNVFQVQNASKGPTPSDLVPIVTRTKDLITRAVNLVVPEKMLGEVAIDVIPDDVEPARVVRIPAAVPSWQTWSWGIAFGAVGALAVMSLAAGFHRLATRKPAPRPSRTAWRDNYAVDEPETGTPAPSERVRELVRQNPEAAAGVLHRWIGQGGPNG